MSPCFDVDESLRIAYLLVCTLFISLRITEDFRGKKHEQEQEKEKEKEKD